MKKVQLLALLEKKNNYLSTVYCHTPGGDISNEDSSDGLNKREMKSVSTRDVECGCG